jgi:arginine/lysine/ornithine decarboxylase
VSISFAFSFLFDMLRREHLSFVVYFLFQYNGISGANRETECQETSVSELTKREAQLLVRTSVALLTKLGGFISAWILMPYPPYVMPIYPQEMPKR